jgi:hypothetical protein
LRSDLCPKKIVQRYMVENITAFKVLEPKTNALAPRVKDMGPNMNAEEILLICKLLWSVLAPKKTALDIFYKL